MNETDQKTKLALILNVIVTGLFQLGIFWILTTFQEFKSIFESMNISLPGFTKLILQLSDLITGILFYVLALGILAVTGFGAKLVWDNGSQEFLLPLLNGIQMLSFFFIFVSSYGVFMPMLTLVNGAG